MEIIEKLSSIWMDTNEPFLIHSSGDLYFTEISKQNYTDLSLVEAGDVVALIGDFNPQSISTLLQLIEKKAILVPLTEETKSQHSYFFDAALVDVVVHGSSVRRIKHEKKHAQIDQLRNQQHSGLVLFSSGTTGDPKAILHDLTKFMRKFETPRPTLRTLNFLLFDHIGGLNTLLHTLFNKGTVIAPNSRKVGDILKLCIDFDVEVLPATPTFLRMMLMSGLIQEKFPKSLKLITYGTERMDQTTLDSLCELLPDVDFRQTFGMSELGIVRVKSKARNSLYMKIGGEGIETRSINGVLEIRSATRMIGYLNAESPFDNEGWYNTKDTVDEVDGHYKIVGRINEIINVGGLKFMASEIEDIVLQFYGVELAKVEGKPNPISGQHVELVVQVTKLFSSKMHLKSFLKSKLPKHMLPRRISVSEVNVGHRFKKL